VQEARQSYRQIRRCRPPIWQASHRPSIGPS